jgi:hypothetical protein
VADVRTPAKIDPEVMFMGLRPNMVVTCTQATMRQRREEAEATQRENERRFTVGITPLLPVGMRGFKG